MAVILPILTAEIYVSVHGIEERPDNAAFAKRIEEGASVDEAAFYSMRKITGFERITYRFEDWINFREYLATVAQMFIILLAATVLATSGEARDEPAT
jgi:hypothetical protein